MRVARVVTLRIHGGSAACAPADIDGSQSTEVAPIGLQRVEDYGGRERRELQANVFARELLLPRSLALRLHADQGLGADPDRGETHDLAKDLVRQQLLDSHSFAIPDREPKPAGPDARTGPRIVPPPTVDPRSCCRRVRARARRERS